MILRGNVFSKVLEMDTGITIVTPNDFKQDGCYKVAYLLHGLSGNSETWLDYSLLPVYTREGNTIYVMPEVGRSFYTDMKYGFKYFSYITEELPKICKSIFNISAERENTLVIGASMGGYGALKCALSKPELYGVCCAFSSACLFLKDRLDENKGQDRREKFVQVVGQRLLDDFTCAFGEELECGEENAVLHLAKSINDSKVKPKIYLTCGINDDLLEENRQFSAEMQKLDFDFVYEEKKGNHDFIFFNDALKRVIGKFNLQVV